MANGSGPSATVSTLNQKVHATSDGLIGQNEVGSGECFDLVDKVLKDAGARSAADFGRVTSTATWPTCGR